MASLGTFLMGVAGLAALLATARSTAAGSGQDGEVPSESGIIYTNHRVSSVPWSLHVVRADRARNDFTFFATLATGKVLGVNRVSEQASTIPRDFGRAIAGVNGDFYERDNQTFAGDPRGFQICNGELVSGPSTVCFWIDRGGNPHMDEVKGDFKVTWPDGRTTPFSLNQQRRPDMAVLYTPTYGSSTRVRGGRDLILEREGNSSWLPLQAGEKYRARVREVQLAANTRLGSNTLVLSLGPALPGAPSEVAPGAILEISTATIPDLKGAPTAIGGGPELIKNGKPFTGGVLSRLRSNNYSERSRYEQHPRSAVGWNATHFYLITVDGRQSDLSIGITLPELAEYLVNLGCTEAMNLDGGKSACLWKTGEIMNSPSEGEQNVANALFLVRKPKQQGK